MCIRDSYFTLQLLDPNTGHHYVEAFLIEAVPPTNGWRFASYALTGEQISAIRGRTVRVRFRVVTNATILTSFFIDDVSFQVDGSVTPTNTPTSTPVSYKHLLPHETELDFVCRLLLEKKKTHTRIITIQQ